MKDTELWSAIVVASSNCRLEDLFQVVDQLSINEKAALVKHLMDSSSLNVEFDKKPLSSSNIGEINTMDKATLGEILQAIANRITQES
jgi:hypothetical protein